MWSNKLFNIRFIFICLITFLFLISGSIVLSQSGDSNQRGIIGDMNEDGIVDSTDYIILTRYVLEIIDELPVEDKLWVADLNGDGLIDSSDVILLGRYLLEMIDEFPKESMEDPTPVPTPSSKPNPTPTPVFLDEKTSNVNTVQGEIFNFVFSADNLKNKESLSALYIYTVTYNPDVLEVVDLCSETYEKVLTPKWVEGTDIEILEFKPDEGMFIFSSEKFFYVDKGLSGALNSVKFKSKADGLHQIDYKVERISEDIDDFRRDVVVDLMNFYVGGANFVTRCANTRKRIGIKTGEFVELSLSFDANTYRAHSISPREVTYDGEILGDTINIEINADFPINVPENKNFRTNITIVNNSGKRIRIVSNNPTGRITLVDRHGDEITMYSEEENVRIYVGEN
ncbi:dockerin type I repeat-containing protein [Herbivorax sp. ANBcel31]|uniref:dockerin type I repeat-containing protein n=1 Tax=Herbivorax sp. ANBcel31 TaxID=3069754 RepID=UPI0027B44B37|nr:dockerin type I repeat-containing protein [Herbivorax sp. ANBcel31]MDQ2085833.1 dockerin type I repeat-containing protein [Herbivorax sp. ANBcel31]